MCLAQNTPDSATEGVKDSVIVRNIAAATDSLPGILVLDSIPDTLNFGNHLWYWVDSTGHATWEDAQQSPYFTPFNRMPKWVKKREPDFLDQAVWTYFDIKNSGNDTLNFYILKYGFYVWSSELIVVGYTDSTVDNRQVLLREKTQKNAPLYHRLQLLPGQKVRIWSREGYEYMGIDKLHESSYYLLSPARWKIIWRRYVDVNQTKFSFLALTIGALFIIAFSSLIQFFILREKVYFVYVLFLSVLLLYEWAWFEVVYFDGNFFVPCPIPNSKMLEAFCLYAGYLTYFRFLKYFLKTARFSHFFGIYLYVAEVVTWTIFGMNMLLFLFHDPYFAHLFYVIIRVIYVLFDIITVVMLFMFRTRLSNLLGIGVLGLALGLTVSFLSIFGVIPIQGLPGIWHDNMTYFHVGILWEVLFFMAALTYKFKIIRDENFEAQISLNEKLRAENELRRLLDNAEITALRAQMSPHFIFNSLSTLNYFVLQRDAATGTKFLTDFAGLMRNVLENSRKPLISLQEEIQMLQQYIAIEQMRFPNKFRFEIEIDKSVQTELVMVPPTILQPYAENAIKHGLLSSKRPDLLLSLKGWVEAHFLHLEITDNGVGREDARATAAKSILHKKESLGLKITLDRIRMAGGAYNPANDVTIEDLYDEAGNSAGTRVTIKIAQPED